LLGVANDGSLPVAACNDTPSLAHNHRFYPKHQAHIICTGAHILTTRLKG
jgi:hypothetical protein